MNTYEIIGPATKTTAVFLQRERSLRCFCCCCCVCVWVWLMLFFSLSLRCACIKYHYHPACLMAVCMCRRGIRSSIIAEVTAREKGTIGCGGGSGTHTEKQQPFLISLLFSLSSFSSSSSTCCCQVDR